MVFSLLGLFFVAFLSWQCVRFVYPLVEKFAGDAVFGTLTTFLNGQIPGTFSSISQFELALSKTRVGLIFSVLLTKIFSNLSFQGSLTSGQILAPTLTTLFLKVLCFVLLFVVFEIILKLLRKILNRTIKKCGFGVGNRILGGGVGLLKALFVFSLLFVTLTALSHFLMNEWLLNFVQGGKISNFLYKTFAQKIFSIFY